MGNVFPVQIVSTVPIGVAPGLWVSTDLNVNFNADMVDGFHAADLMLDAVIGDEAPSAGETLDGAPVFVTVVDVGDLPNAGTKTVAHGIPGLGRVVRVLGTAVRPADNMHVSIPNGV